MLDQWEIFMREYKSIINISFIIIILLFIVNHIVTFDSQFIFLGTLTLILITLMLPSAKGLALSFSIGMLVIAGITAYVIDIPFKQSVPLFTQNMALVILISFAPVLSIPMQLGEYSKEVEKIIKNNTENPSYLYGGITGTFFILGTTLNMGSISIVHSVTGNNGFPKSFLSKAYTRGFTAVFLWSPFFASVFLILFSLDLSIGQYILYGFSLGVIQLIISNLWFNIYEKSKIEFPTLNKEKEEIDSNKIKILLIAFALLILVILVADRFFEGNMSLLITIIIVGFSLIWSLLIRHIHSFLKGLIQYTQKAIPEKVNEIVLFLVAGFFSGIVSQTSLGRSIGSFFIRISDYSVFLVIFSIILFGIIFSFIGIHQIVFITLLLASIDTDEIGITNLIFALTLTSTWSISTLISPIGFVNLITAQLLSTEVTNVIRWNVAFTFIMAISSTIVIYAYHLFL